jgi:hypothetical protein
MPWSTPLSDDVRYPLMPKEIVVIGLVILAGFLAGGVYAAWRTARVFAVLLGVLAVLAFGGAVVWMF